MAVEPPVSSRSVWEEAQMVETDSLNLTAKASKNGWLEDDKFPFGSLLAMFRGLSHC